jgi:hypothetical protein
MIDMMEAVIAASRRRFNPLSLSPALWLDASDANTLFDATSGGSLVAADGTVARWEDKSGNARHVTQATSGSRPVRKTSVQNSRDVVRFDGLLQKLVVSLDLASPFTFIFAGRRNGGTSACGFAGNLQNSGNFDGAIFGHFGSGSNNLLASILTRISSTVQNTSRVDVGNNSLISTAVVGSSSYQGYVNGGNLSEVTATYNARNSSISIGSPRTGSTSTESINGDIAEILVFPTALSTTDRQKVESYLASKWGITLA